MSQIFFGSQNTDNSMNRMRRLMETAKKYSPTAARTINYAFAYGCGFNFQEMDKAYGAYDQSQNMVYLNPKFSDEELLLTMVHECRHALQPKNFEAWEHNIRTNLQWIRAKEADASAHECAAAYEMKKDLPAVWEKFQRKHQKIARSYETSINVDRDPSKALAAAFKSWHDDQKYVAKYDKDTLDHLQYYVGRVGTRFLKKDIAPEQIAEQICKKDGKSYLEKGFMTSDRALTLDKTEVLPKAVQLKYAAYDMTDFKDSSVEDFHMQSTQTGKQLVQPIAKNGATVAPRSEKSDLKNRILAIKNRSIGR